MDVSACPEEDSLDAATANAWIGRDLAAKLRKAPIRPPIYTGEDGMDDDDDDLDLSNLVDPLKVLESDLNLPVIDFTIEECHETWKPWKKALILKLLGKIISYRMLEQRTRDLWKLEWGCELIDFEKAFYVARFYSAIDLEKLDEW